MCDAHNVLEMDKILNILPFSRKNQSRLFRVIIYLAKWRDMVGESGKQWDGQRP
jgi:hypothetical protein